MPSSVGECTRYVGRALLNTASGRSPQLTPMLVVSAARAVATSTGVAGSALAGLGGVLWGLYQQLVIPQIGAQVNVLLFIVIIIGGLGSTLGCFTGALLVGLLANYSGFLAPKVALFSNIGLMVAILLWRPKGLYPVTDR